ncbi:strain DSM [uncultured Sutterella sp.]|uniref:COG4648 family protein n=1 Tax=uncultured Sutterella sp. TaxID=286133 RepID=UPI0025F4B7C7|nr:strain DSM [uncultured Sutterella sp.]
MPASRWIRPLLRGLAALAAGLYPLWAWWGLRHWGVLPVAAALALVMLVRAALKRDLESWGFFATASLLALTSLLLDVEEPMLLYPVLVNVFLLWLFGSSLRGTPVVERLARLKEKNLPPEGVRWCRGVTEVWCGFFILNGLTALATVLSGDRSLWMLWNGCISYVLIGLLFAGEFLLRRLVMKRRARG